MRIGIAHAVPAALEALRRAFSGHAGVQVVWATQDADATVSACVSAPPDALFLGVSAGGLDPVAITERITATASCRIVLVTGASAGERAKVYDAMNQGALDALTLPGLASGDVDPTALAGKLALIRRLVASRRPAHQSPNAPGGTVLVAIGASTGGPAALAEVLSAIDPRGPAAVMIVQHLDHRFSTGLAQWLTQRTGFPVELAATGARPAAGRGLLAATGDHLLLGSDGRLTYSSRPEGLTHRPSIDVFFASLVEARATPGVAVVLTGMGRDGATGLLRLRNARWHTLAQDEATSVVYGMPKAAAELRAAERVVALDRIGSTIDRLIRRQRRPSAP